jgi:serine/threonine-protein kinase
MSELVGKNLGKYRIVAYLGGGGMAHVYKAYHPGLDWHVAIKLMKSDLAARQSSASRFEREAVAVARLRHPNIVQVHDFDAQDSLRYMVMEFIEGPTLRAELIARRDKGQSFSLAETAHLFSVLASALDYAHARGVIHHDLKPDNVMITPDGQVVLTDFGIAQMRDIVASQTAGKEVIGTAEYMAPEQVEGERGDRRSDIYSLGVMLFELAIGRAPFEGTPLAVMLKHINEPLPLPTTFNPQLPPSVEQVILKSLNKKPDERYQTAGALSQALAAAVGLIGEQQAASYITAVALAPHISEISLTPDRPPLSPSAPIPPCPYRGLFAFQEKDAPFFFGREAFVGQLLEAVQRQTLVAVLGPSGSGKSSVVFAGLLPRLRNASRETGRRKDEISPSSLILHPSSFKM